MKAVNIYKAEHIQQGVYSKMQTEINGKWVMARPEGYHSLWHRIECAWLVFTGKCDALRWPEGQ